MIRLKDYLQVLYNAMTDVVDKVYIQDRPQSVSEKTNTYAVVNVSSFVNNREIDASGEFDFYTAQVYIYLFVRDKVTPQHLMQVDIVKMDEIVKKAFEKFPIKDTDKSVNIRKPRIMISVSDDDGWHYSLISASLQTYF